MFNRYCKQWVVAFVLGLAALVGAHAEDAPATKPPLVAPASPAPQAAVPQAVTPAPAETQTGDRSVAPVVTPAAAQSGPTSAGAATPAATLDDRIQTVKGEVIQLNRDLMVLEEELLFPASTQVAVFVSMDVGKMFSLDSVQVKLDDKVVANYLYSPGEVQALHRGGVQRLYLGNLRAGDHELVALFVGGGPHERDYRRGATVKFEKGTEPKYIELQIKDNTGKLQPEFEVKIWQ